MGDEFPCKADGGSVDVQLLPGAAVQGRLLFNGKPLSQSGVRIQVADSLNGIAAGWLRTDAEGRYRITGLEPKSYVVHVLAGQELFGGLTAAPIRDVTAENGKTATADLVCMRGVLVSGRVRDQRGDAVGQTYVGARLLDLPDLNLYRTFTGDDGRFQLRLPSGNYEVMTNDWQRSGRPLEVVEKVVVADAPPAPIELRVTSGAASKTRLVDTDGRTVTGSAKIYGNWMHSDEHGDVAFRLVPGARSMRAGFAISDDKTLAAAFYWPANQDEPPEEIMLKPPATLIGRIHDEGGGKVTADMFLIAWKWTDGRQSTIGWDDGIAWPAVEDDGAFQLKLPTGVQLTATIYNGSQETIVLRPTDLRPGETRDVGEIRLPRSQRRDEPIGFRGAGAR